MDKVINPCKVQIDGRFTEVFCKVEFTDGKLSISGVEGPLASGNCRGSCGQIDGGYYHRETEQNDKRTSEPHQIGNDMKLNEGWSSEMWYTFLEAWHDYHLNDMQAACEHQRAAGYKQLAAEKVTLYHWRLKPDIREQKHLLEAEALEQARSVEDGHRVGFYTQQKAIMRLEDYFTGPTADIGELAGFYELEDKETKALGWLDETEHPRGILSKSCEVCGHKYGCAWLTEAVPASVVKFLESLPDSKLTPAWV